MSLETTTPTRGASVSEGDAKAVLYLRVSTKDQAQRGGEAEGFSIPAQREACEKRAKALGADVIMEFIDAGESARSANRPELQLMLKFLQKQPCDYVIVHKVDRLARNRVDDVEINLAIQRSGAKLVSVTENIDETPSGMLMHGIMSSIAEFYSRNLATEARKGMAQKVKNGGTPGMVPFGYLNVRTRTPEGYEVRTVEVDPDRVDHVRWIFDAYASGELTMTQIRQELERRGVTSLPRPKRPARPMATSHIENILSNRYYLGFVKFDGTWHKGRHESLVSEDTWEKVQEIRRARVSSREKPQQHPHYLKGTVLCGHCGEMLGVEIVRNRVGNRYPYFYCLGRKKGRTTCDFRAISIPAVEGLIEEHWQTRELDRPQRDAIRSHVLKYIDTVLPERDKRIRTAEHAANQLKDERDLLLRAHYAGAVPIDQLRDEQDRITTALAAAEREVAIQRLSREQLQRALESALALLDDAHKHYQSSSAQERRYMNQAVFRQLYLYDDAVADARLTDLFEQLLAPDLVTRLDAELTTVSVRDGRASAHGSKSSNLRPGYQDVGSNFPTLVAGTGFEPATSGL
jgi:site-specific DNA recombinase